MLVCGFATLTVHRVSFRHICAAGSSGGALSFQLDSNGNAKSTEVMIDASLFANNTSNGACFLPAIKVAPTGATVWTALGLGPLAQLLPPGMLEQCVHAFKGLVLLSASRCGDIALAVGSRRLCSTPGQRQSFSAGMLLPQLLVTSDFIVPTFGARRRWRCSVHFNFC